MIERIGINSAMDVDAGVELGSFLVFTITGVLKLFSAATLFDVYDVPLTDASSFSSVNSRFGVKQSTFRLFLRRSVTLLTFETKGWLSSRFF